MLDIFSRMVVGWMLADCEKDELAGQLIAETCERQGILPDQLSIHADRGTSMTSLHVAALLANLGVTKSHSRPRTSNDNPFSESQFKTMKYCPFFPGRFASVAEGRTFFELFFAWYNTEHHHSGIAMLTPAVVHSGRVDEVLAVRQTALDTAHAAHPDRFVRGAPKVSRPATEVWINRPSQAVLPNGEDDSSSSPQKAKNAPAESRPCPAGPPAQASHASAEGVDGLASATGRVPQAVEGQRM